MRIPSLIVAVLTAVPGLPAQEDFEPGVALARLKLLGLSEYLLKREGHPPMSPADVPLALRAIMDEDAVLVAAGCAAVQQLAGKAFYAEVDASVRAAVVRELTRRLPQEDERVGDAAASAIVRLDAVSDARRAKRGGKDLPPPYLSPVEVRQVLSSALPLVMRPNPEAEFRGSRLLAALADNAPAQMHVEMCRAVLAAIRRRARNAEDARQKRALFGLKAALAALPTPDRTIAEEKVAVLLPDARRLEARVFSTYSKANCLRGLARCVPVLAGEPRQVVVQFLVAAGGDAGLAYMPTSGRRAPFEHHGAASLTIAAPHFTAAELDAADAAVAGLRKRLAAAIEESGKSRVAMGAKDLVSMFGAYQAASRARRTALER